MNTSWIDSDIRKRKLLKQKILKVLADINIVDKETMGDIGGHEQLSFPSEFPAGELPDEEEGSTESLYHMPRQAESGQGLTQLTTERESGKPDVKLNQYSLWNKSYHNENQFEDTDKMGESDIDPLTEQVYQPYSNGSGPVNSRYEDANKNKHNIITHAQRQKWVAVDLDGTILKIPPGNKYQDPITGKHLFNDPIPGAKEALQKLIDNDIRVSIYTARQYFAKGKNQEEKLREAIENILAEYDIPYTDIYIGKKPPAHVYVDDRNVPFNGDWESIINDIHKKLEKKAVNKKLLEDIKIEEVSGPEVRKEDIDFTMGGHYYKYPKLIPEDEIWVEKELGDKDLEPTVIHELVERELMKEYDEKYDEAHGVANETEKNVRKKEANDPIKDTKEYKGILIDVEWPKGSIRSYKGDDTYVTHMKCDYGYARGIDGNDGEELDIYFNGDDSDIAYIIEQLNPDGSGEYDEDKIMLGFLSEEDAVDMYLQHMPAHMLGEIRPVSIEKLINALYGKPEDRRNKKDLAPKEEKKGSKDIFNPKINKKTKSDYVGPQTSQVGGIGGPVADKEAQEPIAPMKIKKVQDPDEILKKYDDSDIVIQQKFDGYKTQAIRDMSGNLRLYTRRGVDFSENVPDVVSNLEMLVGMPDGTFILGELIWEDTQGNQSISDIESIVGSTPEKAIEKQKTGNGHVIFKAYDLLWLDGENITKEPYERRYELLENMLEGSDFTTELVKNYNYSEKDDAINEALSVNAEGIVLKPKDSVYEYAELGQREPKGEQVKFKPSEKAQTDEVILKDYTKGKENLIFNMYQYDDKDELINVGKLSGLSKDDESEAATEIDAGKEVVVEITFQERTSAGKFRHTGWSRFRPDKPVNEVRLEKKAFNKQAVYRDLAEKALMKAKSDPILNNMITKWIEDMEPVNDYIGNLTKAMIANDELTEYIESVVEPLGYQTTVQPSPNMPLSEKMHLKDMFSYDTQMQILKEQEKHLQDRYEQNLSKYEQDLAKYKQDLEKWKAGGGVETRPILPFKPIKPRSLVGANKKQGQEDVESEEFKDATYLAQNNPLDFFIRKLNEKYPELELEAVTNLAKNNPYYFFELKLNEKYPELGLEPATDLAKNNPYGFFYFKLNEKYPELELEAVKNLIQNNPYYFFELKLNEKYPELELEPATNLAKNNPYEFFYFKLDEKYPELGLEPATNLAKNNPYGFFYFKLDEKYPELDLGLEPATNLAKNNPYEFFKFGLDEKYPELALEPATNLAKNNPYEFFYFKLDEKYPELALEPVTNLAKNNPYYFFELKLNEKYPELALEATKILRSKQLEYDTQNPNTDNRPLYAKQNAQSIYDEGYRTFVHTGTFDELKNIKNVFGEICVSSWDLSNKLFTRQDLVLAAIFEGKTSHYFDDDVLSYVNEIGLREQSEYGGEVGNDEGWFNPKRPGNKLVGFAVIGNPDNPYYEEYVRNAKKLAELNDVNYLEISGDARNVEQMRKPWEMEDIPMYEKYRNLPQMREYANKKQARYNNFALLAIEQSEKLPELKEIIYAYVDPNLDLTSKADELTRILILNDDLKKELEEYIGPMYTTKSPPVDDSEIYDEPGRIIPTQNLSEEIEKLKYKKKRLEEPSTEEVDEYIRNLDKMRGATKVWPEDDYFDNEYTDGTEDRENRDIPRPQETEKLKYRNT